MMEWLIQEWENMYATYTRQLEKPERSETHNTKGVETRQIEIAEVKRWRDELQELLTEYNGHQH